jgi:hypothetical protein
VPGDLERDLPFESGGRCGGDVGDDPAVQQAEHAVGEPVVEVRVGG